MFKLKISKSLIIYVSVFAFLVLIYGHIFDYLMHTYEGKDYTFITSIYWVIVSMTTVGYGEIVFQSHIGQLFTVIVILSGVVMIFGYLFPLVVTPQLEKTLRRELPSKVSVDFKNHIIICGYNQLVETLIVELDEDRIPFAVIDENALTINHLLARKIMCVQESLNLMQLQSQQKKILELFQCEGIVEKNYLKSIGVNY